MASQGITCYDDVDGTPVLGLTCTDVARYSGALEHIFESTLAEVTIQTPQLDINTVAVGGGSILTWENGLLKVGPRSAGADPGPACYGKGGPLTVMDANFLLGRIIPDFFPRSWVSTLSRQSLLLSQILSTPVILEVDKDDQQDVSTETVDPVQLSVFGHRFMTVAEPMRHTMEKTSISVNIKERLDYSCAVFAADGGLVANAPHVPSHLGSMSTAIVYQAQRYKPGELKLGDVIIANHPITGGTHLPDITTKALSHQRALK